MDRQLTANVAWSWCLPKPDEALAQECRVHGKSRHFPRTPLSLRLEAVPTTWGDSHPRTWCRRAAPGTVRPGPPRGVGEGAGAGPCPHAKARRGPVSPRSRALAGRFGPLHPEVGGLGSSSAVEGASRVSPCDPLRGQLTEPAEGRPSWRGRCHRRVRHHHTHVTSRMPPLCQTRLGRNKPQAPLHATSGGRCEPMGRS